MNSIKCFVAALTFGWVFGGLQAASVSDITTKTHYPWNGRVDVSYAVSGIEDGSEYAVSAIVRTPGKDYGALSTNITADGTYSFSWDAAAAGFVGRVEDAKVIFTVAEPNYAIVDLSAGATATKYPVAYRATVPDATSDTYKTTKLLLKRLGAKYVGVYETTQKQYELVMGVAQTDAINKQAYFSLYDDKDVEAKRPIERISYEALTENGGFFDRLASRSGLPFALPTGEEWEAAARGKMPTDKNYNLGENNYMVITGKAVDNTWLPLMGRYVDLWKDGKKTVNGNNNPNRYTDANKGTAIVGSYNANDNGLYDIHGNVAEWTTEEAGEGEHVLRGGSWLDSAEACSINAKWSYKGADESQIKMAGFRVFGDELDDAFVHQTTAESNPFAVDVDSDNIRQVRVADDGGKYTFFYTPEGGEEIGWVKLTDFEDWYPTHAGDNVATHPTTGETATFRVKALDIEIKAYPVTVTYDGEGHTIKGPTVEVPAAKFDVVYWCADKEGQATENEATDEKIYFTDVKRDPNDNSVLSYAIWYKVTSAFYTSKAECQQLTINPRAIKAAQVRFGDTLTYNGRVQTNTVTSVTMTIPVPAKTLTLAEGTDYTVVDNWGTEATRYTATFSGIGNYTGTRTEAWEIVPFDIGQSIGGGGTAAGVAITFSADYEANGFTYNGKVQTITVASVSVTVGGSKQTFDATSFEVVSGDSGRDATANVGKPYVVTIKGIRNFQGTATREWEIKQYDITPRGAATIVFTGDPLTYDGTEQTREVGKVTTAAGDVPLVECEISGNKGVEATAKVGKYTAKVAVKDERSNFKGSTTKDWSIAQKSIKDVAFTLDPEYDYIYSRTAKEPGITADDGARGYDGKPMIAKDAGTEWTVAYSDNTNAGENTAKATITASATGNYTGEVVKNFTIKPATIDEAMTLEKDTFTYDGTEKTPVPQTVTARDGMLTLEADEYKLTSGSAKETDHYKAEVQSASPNFTGVAIAPWKIVPATPEVYWFGMQGKESVTGENGIKYFYVSDLTVAGDSKCAGEKLVWSNEVLNAEGKWVPSTTVIANDKFHVKGRTRVNVYSVKADAELGDLIGNPTTVELVPGKCADLVVTPPTFNRNHTVLTIEAKKEGGDFVVDGQPLKLAPNYQPYGVAGTTYFKVLDGKDKEVVGKTAYNRESSNLEVSADKVKVVTWTEDQQYVWSNVKTQEVTRTIGDVAKPVVKIERVQGDVSKRLVTITCDTANAVIYWTSATSNGVTHVSDGYPAINPKGACEVGYQPTDGTLYTPGQTLEFELEKDIALSVKAVAYELWGDDPTDFKGRSAVAHEQDLRAWGIGDAMDCPDQEFFNGTNQIKVIAGQGGACEDVDFFVTNDVTAVGGECMRSGKLPHGNLMTSSLTTFVDGPGMIVFNWKSNCEDDPEGTAWDHGEFVVDGVITQKIDGVTGWQTVTNMLANTGRHMLTWTYVKDFTKQGVGAFPEGEDCLLVDCFVWTPAKSFGDIDITVDHLVYNMQEQVPTKTATTNYIHAVTSDPRTGLSYELVEGEDYTVQVDKQTKADTYSVTLKATEKSLLVKDETTVDWTIDPLDISKAAVGYDSQFTYDGAPKMPTLKYVKVQHYLGEVDVLTETDGYTQTDVPQTEAGSYTFTLVGSGNLVGTTSAAGWTIERRDFGTVTLTLEPTEFTYDCTEHKPGVTVTDSARQDTQTLEEGKDYDVTWPADMTNACDKLTVTITGKGNYQSVTKTADYKINKATVQSVTLNEPTTLTYNGAEQGVTVASVLTANGITVPVSEYDLTGDKGTVAGGYTATVTIKTDSVNFTGDPVTADWKIDPLDIAGANVVVAPNPVSFVYDREKHEVLKKDITGATADGMALDLAKISVACDAQSEKGSYTYSITANEQNFTGTKTGLAWEIKPTKILGVTADGQLTWNGKSEVTIKGTDITRKIVTRATEQTQTITVKGGEEGQLTLVEGEDYTVIGNKATKAGEYKLTVTGINNFEGSSGELTWTIKPKPVIITPNVLNPTELEELLATGTARIMIAAEDETWTAWYSMHTFKDGVAQPESVARRFRTFNIKQRTVITGWAVSKDGKVASDKISVDYKMGMAAEPVSVLQNMDALPDFCIPVYNDSGLAWTNETTGLQTPTNFFYNGQRVVLTRGNVASNGTVIAGTEANRIYIDGALAYTLDGTEPIYTNGVLVGTTKLWETNKVNEIVLTNTTTVIAKVFGDQYFDSDPVTNVFVRARNRFATPTISFKTNDWEAAAAQVFISTMPYQIKAERNDADTTFGKLVYSLDEGKTTNDYVDVITTNASVKVWAWVEDVNSELEPSEKATAEFICDGQLAKPFTAFNADDPALAQYQDAAKKTFKNKKQVIDLKREDSGLTKDTDGVLRVSLDEGKTWATNVTQVTIWGTSNVWVQAIQSTQGLADSEICKDLYAQEPESVNDPCISINPTKTVKQMEVIIDSDPNTTVYYTLDGTDPIGINESGVTSTKYAGKFIYDIAVDEKLVVKAIAYKEDGVGDFYGRSGIAEKDFTREETIADVIKSDDPEKQAKPDQPDTSDLPFDNSDNTKWKDSEGTEFDTAWRKDEIEATTPGGSSLRSGDVRDGDVGEPERISTLKVKVRGPGKISFNWKSSTEFVEGDPETAYDFGTFYVDGVAIRKIWGTNDWSEVTYVINESSDEAQDHELKWTYEKDWMDDEYQEFEDCIWVDDFVWAPVPDMKQMSIVQSPSLTYNLSEQSPTFIVTLTNEQGVVVATLEKDVDYTIEATAQTAAGEYDYTLNATGTNYTGSVSGKWTIGKVDFATMPYTDFVLEYYYTTYNGQAQRPAVKAVKLNGTTIDASEYTVSYEENPVNVGTHKVTITANDINFTGVKKPSYQIQPLDIATATVTLKDDLTYIGYEQTNEVVSITVGDLTLEVEKGDYSITNNWGTTATNTYTATVWGFGNYKGSVDKDWTIAPLDMSYANKGKVEFIPGPWTYGYIYDGLPKTAVVERVVIQHPNGTLVTNDYTIGYNRERNVIETNVGSYSVTVVGTNNLTGARGAGWKISEHDFKDVTITLSANEFVYNGEEQKPIVTVTIPAPAQVTENDYEITWPVDPTNAGEKAITVTPKGNYGGNPQTVTYTILKAGIETLTLAEPSTFTFDKTEKKVEVASVTTTNGVTVTDADYDFTGNTGTAAATYTATVTAKVESRNFAGSATATWTIEQRDAKTLTVEQDPATFVYNRQEQKPTVTVKCGDVVFDESDYEIVWPSDCINASNKIEYVVKGKGSVTNEVTMSYAITPAPITKLQFQAQPGKPWVCTYDGTKQYPKVAYVKATAAEENDLTLTVDEYMLTNVGKTDVGEYVSEVKSTSRNFCDQSPAKTATWKIAPKSIEGAEVVVTLKKPIVYTGYEQWIKEDNVEKITVKAGALVVGACDFDCPKHTDAGDYDDATVTPKATNKNFTGTAKVQWTIEQRDITDATIVWENARLLWNGEEGVPATEQTPVVKAITVGGPDLEAGETLDFAGTLATLTVDDGDKTEAGRYASTVTGAKNFKGTTTQAQVWEIVPKAPLITPNDGTGKYTKLADYVTVEINNNTSNQLWSIFYTTNGWAETKAYPVKGGKWDIEGHTVVEAYAVSCDGLVTGETARCEYFFGKRNVAPTIGLTALEGAEAGRPSPWTKDNTEVKGAAKLIVTDNDNIHTNFFHGKTKVYLTRFGAMTQAEIDQTVEDSTTDKGLCPYLDGEIWYTMAENGAPLVAPTNAAGFGSTLFETSNPASWPTISTNAVIVAKVFGKELENSAEVTNVFQRLWTTMPKPTIKWNTQTTAFHTNVVVSIQTNTLDTADWTYTNDSQKIWITVGDKTPFLYTNAFELTWKDCTGDPEQVVVKAVSKYGEDYLDSEADEQTFTHGKKPFPTPTMTPSDMFRHAKDGFKVSLTNNAPEDVGGVLQYALDDGEFKDCILGSETVRDFDFYVTTTTVVRVRVFANGNAHDYTTSATNEATYTYAPYKMVAPTFDKDSQEFADAGFTFTIALPTEDPMQEDYEHRYHGTLCYSLNGGAWENVAGSSKEFTISESTTVAIKQTLADHEDSDVVSRVYNRKVTKPEIRLVDEDGNLFPTETEGGKTNYYHKAFVEMTCAGGDTHVEYELQEEGSDPVSGTAGEKITIPVSKTFTVRATSVTAGGSTSASVTATFTRKWETLVEPKISLIDPLGDSATEFRNTGDRIAITNDEVAVAEHTAVLWPTNFTVKYAVYTNSNDTTTVPTDWATFVQGVTTNFFKADTNAVWAVVEADDYLPSTNAVSFIRQFTGIGELTEDMVHFYSPETRYEVDVTFDMPFAASTIYYTYEITNDESGVSTPWGNEYDVTKSSARFEGAFKVAIKPRQTLIVKARAYREDESSALVGVAETNFVSRGEVVVAKYTLPWTIADALDCPDPETPFTVSDSIAKEGNTNCVEDTVNFNFGGSSMVFTNLVDNETVTLETVVTGPGTVTFDWRTSCEQGQHGYNHDYLAFSVDGTEVARLDGESGWTNVTFKIDGAMGDIHFLQWSYKKDAAEKKGTDCAWVDHFTWTSGLQKSDITDDLDTWFQTYEPYPGYYDEMLAGGDLTNWREALGMDSAVTGRSYWDCYVLGLDPDDWTTDFTAGAPVIEDTEDTEGKLVPKSVTIAWTPCTKAGRTYSLVGKKTLIDADWTILATLNATAEDTEGGSITASLLNDANKDYKFFQLRVRMTK